MTIAREKILLDNFFQGDLEKFDFNQCVRTGGQQPLYFSEERILNPSKTDYIAVKKFIRSIIDNTLAKYGEGSSFVVYNALLMVLAAMELCIDDAKMEEWEADPALQLLNKTERK